MGFVEQDERKVQKNLEMAREILLDDIGYYWMSDPRSKFNVFVSGSMNKKVIVDKVLSVQDVSLSELLQDYNGYRTESGRPTIQWGTITTDALFLFLDEMVCSMCMKSLTECDNSIGCTKCSSWFHVNCVTDDSNDYQCTLCLLKSELRQNNDNDDDDDDSNYSDNDVDDSNYSEDNYD